MYDLNWKINRSKIEDLMFAAGFWASKLSLKKKRMLKLVNLL